MKCLIPTMLAIASAAPALETPLVVRPTGTGATNYDYVLEISPNVGTMNLYQANVSAGTSRSAGEPFLNTLEYLDQYIFDERKGVPYTLLRIGMANCNPTSEKFLDMLPNKPTALEESKKIGSAQARAREAEDNYWSKEHEYDGVVRAAWNGSYAMLCVPSKHALLFYDTTGDKLVLQSYMNYGPQLLLGGSDFGTSTPTANDVFATLPKLVKAKIDDENKKAEEAAAGIPKETPKSEAWVGAALNNVFVLVDTANNVLMTYEFNGKTLIVHAVRNIRYDLMIPPRQNYKSTPNEEEEATNYIKQRKKALADAGLDADPYSIRALVAANVHGKAAQTGMQANMFEDKVVLDFTEQHKLLVYGITTQGIDFTSSRDYTLDLGISLMEQEIDKKSKARAAVAEAEKNFKSHGRAMRLLKFALKMDPSVVDSIEKSSRLSGELKKEADWDPMIDEGHKDKDKADAARKAMREAAKKAKDDDDALAHPKPEEKK